MLRLPEQEPKGVLRLLRGSKMVSKAKDNGKPNFDGKDKAVFGKFSKHRFLFMVKQLLTCNMLLIANECSGPQCCSTYHSSL